MINIDGQNIKTKFSGIGNPTVMVKVAEFMGSGKPFRLYSASHKGLIVHPGKQMYYDKDNNQFVKYHNPGQIQWVLQCAMIVYDQIEMIQEKHKIEFVKKFLELPANTVI